jgi:quercetin dioxygenase-like cupin family protein
VQPLLAKELSGIPGKEGVIAMVNFPPGHSDGVHRHNAHVFVYVLEGSVIMQLKGRPPVTLNPGDTFYESPEDIHLEGRNASDKVPAKFIAFFVKDKGAPILASIK